MGAELLLTFDFIDKSIHSAIEKSDLIICDISDNHGDVLYGLGYAHALKKPVIQICRNDATLPFVLTKIQTLIYKRKYPFKGFINNLKKTMKSALDNPENWIFQGNESRENEANHLFISYNHKDRDFLERLQVHLKPLVRENIIDLWDDTKLLAGDKWKEKIEESLKKARVAILLISADFLASDFIVDNELPPLLLASEAKGTRVIPIVVNPCRFSRDKNLSSFHAINDPKKPVTKLSFSEQEELYDKVSALVESHIKSCKKKG